MANDPFTIGIFVSDGNPEGVRIIDRMNRTGPGIVFPRDKWPTTKQRSEFSRPDVYVLTGYRGAEAPHAVALPCRHRTHGRSNTDAYY